MLTKRNLIALASLIVLVPLAIFVSAYRYNDVYQAGRFSQPIAAQNGLAHYVGHSIVDGKNYERHIDVKLLNATQVSNWNGIIAPKGAKMWVFEFQFSADPKVPASECGIRVLDKNNKIYRMGAATIVDFGTKTSDVNFIPCVPREASGPKIDIITQKIKDSPIPRPQTWTATLGMAIPEGVTPDRVQIAWDLPAYAEFPISLP